MEIPIPSRSSLLYTSELLKETALSLDDKDTFKKIYLKAYEELIRLDAFIALFGFAPDNPLGDN